MILHSSPLFSIYFGDGQRPVYHDQYDHLSQFSPEELLDEPLFDQVKKSLDLKGLFFLFEVMGAQGVVVTKSMVQNSKVFVQEGDFLITNEPNIGLGLVTADCLPIIFYDPEQHAVGIAHAGWKNSIAGIATNMLGTMQKEYGTASHQIKVFFGPHASACCYEVSKSFEEHLKECEFTNQVLISRADLLYFDILEYNRQLLMHAGILPEHFDVSHSACTIENDRFISFRRDSKKDDFRPADQMTIVALNEK